MECPARRYNIFPVWIRPSPQPQNVAFQEVFSGHTDCILTFSLGLFVPTLRRFCRLRSTIWWHDTVIGDRCFSSCALKVCNSLPKNVQSASSLTSFKAELKTHLFNTALNWSDINALQANNLSFRIFSVLTSDWLIDTKGKKGKCSHSQHRSLTALWL